MFVHAGFAIVVGGQLDQAELSTRPVELQSGCGSRSARYRRFPGSWLAEGFDFFSKAILDVVVGV